MTTIVMVLGLLTAFAVTLKLGAPRPQPIAIRKD
jgi:hypothetical protein